MLNLFLDMFFVFLYHGRDFLAIGQQGTRVSGYVLWLTEWPEVKFLGMRQFFFFLSSFFSFPLLDRLQLKSIDLSLLWAESRD